MQFLRKIAFPVSLIYALVVYIRNFLYESGLLRSKSFKTPTICVGNLSVGGTGKTPMIELLIALLNGYKIAVLSRGYRRKTRGFILLSEESNAQQVGDEPLQIYAKYPNIHVAVDEDRQHGISQLEESIVPDVILLDDAFQHRRVKAEFYILLSAYDNLYTDDWYLPTGNLRDSKHQAKRADVIIVTKCPENMSEADQLRVISEINPGPDQEVLFSKLEYEDKIKGFNAGMPLSALKQEKITLVTGIADPKPLLKYLRQMGLEFEHLAFKDHHFFSKKEVSLLRSKSYLLTTEKDYMRSGSLLNALSYIEVRHRLIGSGREILIQKLNGVLGS
ncbi:MAG: tetraacyldisaccharide 4'-kinase [Eudoraea sp.]|nr:tetraacyldisaccharide 4'-kinase [Eudoraea sp.]